MNYFKWEKQFATIAMAVIEFILQIKLQNDYKTNKQQLL